MTLQEILNNLIDKLEDTYTNKHLQYYREHEEDVITILLWAINDIRELQIERGK